MGKRPPKNGVRINDKNILLVDGNSLFNVSYHGAKNMYNYKGEHVGGIYQFLTHLRKLIKEKTYHQVFVFWDGKLSGRLRWDVYKDYKKSRNKDYINGTEPQDATDDEKKKTKNEKYQQGQIRKYLEELYVRQIIDNKVEGDDFIAYFCNQRKPNEKITIASGDKDIHQLIDEGVEIYYLNKLNINGERVNVTLTEDNYRNYFNIRHDNVLVSKILTGDNSDDIKGIKGLGESTLLKLFPEIADRKISLEEIKDKARKMQDERLAEKKSRLKVLDNIINGVTDGCQGDNFYEINEYIINLKKPLLTEEAIENVDFLINSEIDPDGRSFKNVYNRLKTNGIQGLLSESSFTEYLLPFKKLVNRERSSIT